MGIMGQESAGYVDSISAPVLPEKQPGVKPRWDSYANRPKAPAIDPRIDAEKLMSVINREITLCLEDRVQWQQNKTTWLELYKGIAAEKIFPWKDCSNLFIPLVPTIIDTIHARLLNPLLSSTPIANVKGGSDKKSKNRGGGFLPGLMGDAEPKPAISDSARARNIEHFLHYLFTRVIDVFQMVYDSSKSGLIYGGGVIKIVWKREYRKRSKYYEYYQLAADLNDLMAQIGVEGMDDEKKKTADTMAYLLDNHDWEKEPLLRVARVDLVYDAPEWIFVPIDDFLVAPQSRDIQSAPFAAHRFVKPKDYVHKMALMGEYDADAAEEVTPGKTFESSGFPISLAETSEFQEGKSGSAFHRDSNDANAGVELMEIYLDYDIEGDGCLYKIVATVDWTNKRLLSAKEFEYDHGKKPFSIFHPYPMPGRFESMGIPELLKDLQLEINNIHNIRIDNSAITNNAMFWYDPASDIDPDIHKPCPGRGFPARKDQIGILETGDVKFSQYKEEELTRRMAQDRLGVTDYSIGNSQTAQQNSTATGITSIIQESNVRMELLFRSFKKHVEEAMTQTLQLEQQYGSNKIYYKAVDTADGEDVIRSLDIGEIIGQYDVEINATSVNTNRFLAIQELRQQIDLALQVGPAFVNLEPLLRDWFDKMGAKNISEAVMPIQEAFMKLVTSSPQLLAQTKQQIDSIYAQITGTGAASGNGGGEGSPQGPSPQAAPPTGMSQPAPGGNPAAGDSINPELAHHIGNAAAGLMRHFLPGLAHAVQRQINPGGTPQ